MNEEFSFFSTNITLTKSPKRCESGIFAAFHFFKYCCHFSFDFPLCDNGEIFSARPDITCFHISFLIDFFDSDHSSDMYEDSLMKSILLVVSCNKQKIKSHLAQHFMPILSMNILLPSLKVISFSILGSIPMGFK